MYVLELSYNLKLYYSSKKKLFNCKLFLRHFAKENNFENNIILVLPIDEIEYRLCNKLTEITIIS